MEESDQPVDGLLEEPEAPPTTFPLVGVDKTPTAEALAAGLHGNGSWDLTDDSIERAYAEVHQAKKAEADERRQFFNEKAKDALADAIDYHHRIVKRGLLVMDRIEGEEDYKPSRADMAILGMAFKSSKELADRGMGRAATASGDEASTTSILSLIQRRAPDA